ncbi:uncharacterized protein LOC125043357 [Penaeus chinensis]|uniref:uncharacterized protein LOC125043357 n=1 Tax=Penaeus chinensis TaxID=139456 RepID=UPI001FB73161|nr:uncharacterized protein LOC125043357 [Penaeus chinensis]
MVAARAALVYLSVVALVAGAATLTTHRPSGTTTPHAHESYTAHPSHEAPKNHSNASSTEKTTELALRDDEDEAGNKTAPNEDELAAPLFELQAVKRDSESTSDKGGGVRYEEEGDLYTDVVNGSEDELEELPVPMAQSARVKGFTRSDGTYVVNDEDGYGCVLAYFKAEVTIYYADVKGDYQSKLVSPEDDSEVSGTCDRIGKVSEVVVGWKTFVLGLRFGLDEITDSWYVSRFSLSYDLSDPEFASAAPGGGEVTVASKDNRKYWQTNNARSFRCLLLHDVPLTDSFNNSATLHFDEVRVQAFSSSDRFRTPKHCIHRVHRDEMVPVTVGASLAASALLTIAFYGIFRYFKVKKVNYDTME